MRTRNIKINVYLNEDEKNMLLEKSNSIKLSQSDFIRKLITNYSKSQTSKEVIDKTINSLLTICENLSRLSNRLSRLYSYKYMEFLNEQIYQINNIINKLQN